MSLFALAVTQPAKMLKNLSGWLDKAAASAEARGFSPDAFLASRLAPDMYSLDRQIQGSCDAAKFMAARLGGQKAPSHPDNEKTLAELQARLKAVISYLDTFTPAQFEGAEARKISLPFLDGKTLLGDDYLVEVALPNFYFNVTTAYAILRHNGVDVGKRDYVGSLNLQDPA